jgi:hypothetical protein
MKLHENSSSGSGVVPCGGTDMTKLTVAFRGFAKARKNLNHKSKCSAISKKETKTALDVKLRTNIWWKIPVFLGGYTV